MKYILDFDVLDADILNAIRNLKAFIIFVQFHERGTCLGEVLLGN